MKNFASCYDLQNLIKEPTCVKEKLCCIDLILTNNKNYFKDSKTFVTGVLDFHKLIATATKINLIKNNPKIKYYQDYKSFDTACLTKIWAMD